MQHCMIMEYINMKTTVTDARFINDLTAQFPSLVQPLL